MRQALVSATGTFWDTVVVCALTGRLRLLVGYGAGLVARLAFAGVCGVGAYYALLFYAFSTHRYALQFQVLNYLFPVMTVLFMAALVPGEGLSILRAASVLLAFFGAHAIILLDESLGHL